MIELIILLSIFFLKSDKRLLIERERSGFGPNISATLAIDTQAPPRSHLWNELYDKNLNYSYPTIVDVYS